MLKNTCFAIPFPKMSGVVAVTHEIAAKQDGAAQAAPAGFGAVSLLGLVLSMRMVRGTPVACFAACFAPAVSLIHGPGWHKQRNGRSGY